MLIPSLASAFPTEYGRRKMFRGAFKLRGADTNISSPEVPQGSTDRPFCATHAADIQIQLDWEEMQIAKTSQTVLRLLTASCAVYRRYIYL